jgi:hypothetical protein
VRLALKEEILGFIRDSCVDKALKNKDIQLNRRMYCSVVKTAESENAVKCISPAEVISLGYIDKLTCTLLQSALTKKYGKLMKFSQPKILILLRSYTNIDPEIAQRCKPNLDHLDDFHTIFIVSDKNYVFHSKIPD